MLKWGRDKLLIITQPVIRVKIQTQVCLIPKSLKFAFLPHCLRSSAALGELMFLSIYHERGTVLSVYKGYLIYPHNSRTVGDIRMSNFADNDEKSSQGHWEREWQNRASNSHNLIPETLHSRYSYLYQVHLIKLDAGGCPVAILWGVLEAVSIPMSEGNLL